MCVSCHFELKEGEARSGIQVPEACYNTHPPMLDINDFREGK